MNDLDKRAAGWEAARNDLAAAKSTGNTDLLIDRIRTAAADTGGHGTGYLACIGIRAAA